MQAQTANSHVQVAFVVDDLSLYTDSFVGSKVRLRALLASR